MKKKRGNDINSLLTSEAKRAVQEIKDHPRQKEPDFSNIRKHANEWNRETIRSIFRRD